MADYGIIPGTGAFGVNWPSNHTLPQGKGGSISSAGWTEGNEGFPQQTFLGASLRSFNVSAGFGDTTSTLSVDVVNDEYNKSDGLPLGQGDDVYHGGVADTFRPPVVGTPVFFKFGKNFADIEQAFRRVYDSLYDTNTLSNIVFPVYTTQGEITSVPTNHYLRSFTGQGATQVNTWVDKSSLLDSTNPDRGKDHFAFGGILQSYTENRTTDSGPLYSIQVSDPREILSNAVILLNNYQGTTYNNKNLFNAYGFLEYDVSDTLLDELEQNPFLRSKSVLTKQVDNTGNIAYIGDDTYNFDVINSSSTFATDSLPPVLPITGQGFSRRGDQGIPWYRVNQALTAMFNYNGALPQEYVDAGFGGTIDFRGYKYVVDFSGIPLEKIPKMYFMDFDQLDMLSLAQELCDVISHDLFVTLLPVINHPSSQWLYDYNQYEIGQGNNSNIIAGIIRVDAIDRSTPPSYGAIKSYLDNLTSNGVEIKNRDVGFELSNVTTDKFVVGAQEVNMYYFTNNKDRNNTQLRRKTHGLDNDYEALEEQKWKLDNSFKQQILPFYGFLGEKAVSIPRGYGSYQQIMFDTTTLNAVGVGNYYIATELELRMALKGYKDWSDLLASYDEVYVEDISTDKTYYKALQNPPQPDFSDSSNLTAITDAYINYRQAGQGSIDKLKAGNYAVAVPRCVFSSDKNFMGDDGYPASPCSPPYGYPLYYKRAEKIGIAQAGAASFATANTAVTTNLATLKKRLRKKLVNEGVSLNDDDILKTTEGLINDLDRLTAGQESSLPPSINKKVKEDHGLALQMADELKTLIGDISKIKTFVDGNGHLIKKIKSIGLDGVENAKKVHKFIRNAAEENLGKKFLVKIPKACNLRYDERLSTSDTNTFEFEKGPFGFKPQPINSDTTYSDSSQFNSVISDLMDENLINDREIFSHYLDKDAKGKYSYGALKGNFNPVAEKWDFNYEPNTQGGFFDFALHDRNLSFTESSSLDDSELPPGTQQQLIPRDLSNFVDANGRIKCFARYDHSEWLDFTAVSKNSFTQQKIVAGGMVPDVLEELDNVNPDKTETMDRIKDIQDGQELPPSVAFVACTVDENLYMAPKTITQEVDVYGRETKWVMNATPLDVKIQGSGSITSGVLSLSGVLPIFTLKGDGGKDGQKEDNEDFQRVYNADLDSYLIDTDKQNLDSEHVYALITVPGRLKPTVESRYLDGIAYGENPHVIKHSMTQDVVRGPAGFDKPAPAVVKPSGKIDPSVAGSLIALHTLNYAKKMQKLAEQNAGKGSRNPVMVAQSEPSPVYPDIVAIPLTSMERCYGPWMSSAIKTDRVKYSDIGGKIEFVKDENIAPWNYAGYQLMNEAGKLQAEFSNSLLLFSERGGFSIPEAPTGISLATALKAGGPLITSINVDIGDSISTTIKMDLYTSRFGKLQKQKETAIAGITRERQKIIDRNNKAIRKGIGKSSTDIDLLAPIRGIGEQLERTAESSRGAIKTHIELVARNDRVNAKFIEDTKIYEEDKAKEESRRSDVARIDPTQSVGASDNYKFREAGEQGNMLNTAFKDSGLPGFPKSSARSEVNTQEDLINPGSKN